MLCCFGNLVLDFGIYLLFGACALEFMHFLSLRHFKTEDRSQKPVDRRNKKYFKSLNTHHPPMADFQHDRKARKEKQYFYYSSRYNRFPTKKEDM